MGATDGGSNIMLDTTGDTIAGPFQCNSIVIGGAGTGTVSFARADGTKSFFSISKANAGSVVIPGPHKFPFGVEVTMAASINVSFLGC